MKVNRFFVFVLNQYRYSECFKKIENLKKNCHFELLPLGGAFFTIPEGTPISLAR